jgi:pantoate--beta-alanine ligase
MQIIESKEGIVQLSSKLKNAGEQIGFVPTMGALHNGHISLIKQSIKDNDFTIVSIFINPTQFNNAEDLKNYPSTKTHDIELIEHETEEKNLAVYLPRPEDIYPLGHDMKKYEFGLLVNEMEGVNRPGHFQGVGNVLDILFDQVKPDKAYFGDKDFQQVQIVRKLVDLLDLKVKIIACPIIREQNGLAMSSRNIRLAQSGRKIASKIHEALISCKQDFEKKSISELEERAKKFLESNENINVEYFTIRREEDLSRDSQKILGQIYRAFVVAHIDGVRLIDNMRLN